MAETVHARETLKDDDALYALALRLGLQPDVLVEARSNVRARERSVAYVQPWALANKVLLLTCAEEPFMAWEKHVSAWGISSSELMRSLVYAYLRGTYEPPRERLSRLWIWNGRPVRARRPFLIQTVVKYGAYLALLERARRLDHTVSAVLRALVLENMDGRFGQRGVLTIMDLRSMPGDPEHYLKGQ